MGATGKQGITGGYCVLGGDDVVLARERRAPEMDTAMFDGAVMVPGQRQRPESDHDDVRVDTFVDLDADEHQLERYAVLPVGLASTLPHLFAHVLPPSLSL